MSISGSGMNNKLEMPSIALSADTIKILNDISIYTKIINELVGGYKLADLKLALKSSQSKPGDKILQHALIFCLKAIGVLIERAGKSQNLLPKLIEKAGAGKTQSVTTKTLPIFWTNILYLRNNLVHNCPAISMEDNALDLLAQLTSRNGQIYQYFCLVINAKNTKIKLDKRYKVFLDFHDLSQELNSKYHGKNFNQEYYIQILINIISYIEKMFEGIKIINEDIALFKKNNLSNYYALQNFLELISTIANPTEGCLTESTREKIKNINPDAIDWLRSLANSRILTMHSQVCISDTKFKMHLQDMVNFKNVVLINSEFQKHFNVNLLKEEKSENKSNSAAGNKIDTVTKQIENSLSLSMTQKLITSLNKGGLVSSNNNASNQNVSNQADVATNKKQPVKKQ